MIRTLLGISWLNLKRDYVALGLTFILPIVFFSIFAVIFGSVASGSGGGGGGDQSMAVIVVDQDETDVSRRFVESIDAQDALRVVRRPKASDETPEPPFYTRETARKNVRGGGHSVAIIIPEGFGASFGTFNGDAPAVEVIHDPANPIAAPTVSGLLQASAMMAAPDVLMEQGLGQLEKFGEALTPKQREAVDAFLPALRGDVSFETLDELFAGGGRGKDADTDTDALADADTDAGTDADADAGTDTDADTDADALADADTLADADAGFAGLVRIETIEARAEDEAGDDDAEPTSMVAYYAAGVGVMFLLFSMAGAGGALLEEEENGTLERLLTSHVRMRTLLLGNWLFFGLVGATQIFIMFLWGALVFGLDLFTPNHFAGFIAMTVVTAAAAAAFGIVLATLCKSRAQLSGLSTIIILIMSALGGSMMPKFVAPDLFAATSPFTFNGWALDGYLAVFWYDDPAQGVLASVGSLWPQLLVLVGLTVVFLAVARVLARRWEVA